MAIDTVTVTRTVAVVQSAAAATVVQRETTTTVLERGVSGPQGPAGAGAGSVTSLDTRVSAAESTTTVVSSAAVASVASLATRISSTDSTVSAVSSTVADGGGGGGVALPIWGDGADGNVTISSGVTTLTRNMFYNNLTINGTGSLNAAGWDVFVAGTLDLTAAPAGCCTTTAPTRADGPGA